jgi:hypothetical protein
MAAEEISHPARAEALRAALATSGALDTELRLGVMRRAAGGTEVPEPYDAVAVRIGEGGFRVTDGQVAAVREAAGSDRAAFEVVLAASAGAALARWDAAIHAIEGAGVAPA